ncbi:MAG: hypothetical protein E7163_05035 [Firmicutes bacterium]|nr:hypothetical protein [Bacillota bacterium]
MEDNVKKIETKLNTLMYIVISGFVIIGLLVIGLYFTNNGTSVSEEPKTTESDTNYDVSKMNTVTGKEATELFDKKGTHFLYIGRPTCGVCVNLVPNLNATIEELDVTINYLELESTFRDDFGDLFDHLDIKTKINGEEGTFGELLETYGYTPLVIIIKDGKMIEGFVGSRDSETIIELFKKYI